MKYRNQQIPKEILLTNLLIVLYVDKSLFVAMFRKEENDYLFIIS